MNSLRALVPVAAVAAIAGVAWAVFVGPEVQRAIPADPRPSSYSAAPAGVKAWYELLRASGCQVERLGDEPDALPPGGTLVVASPTLGFSKPQVDAVRAWVMAGGHLVLVGNPGPQLGRAMGVQLVASAAPARLHVRPVLPTGLARSVGVVYAGPGRAQLSGGGFALHYADANGALVAEWQIGRGRVTAIADDEMLSNQLIGRADNAILAVRVARPEPVIFDEYHHGHRTAGSLWAALVQPYPLLWIQVIVAALMGVWSVSRRFGSPLPDTLGEESRSSAEYIWSMATLMRRAGADGTALEVLGARLRRDASAWLGAQPHAPDEELVLLAAQRAPEVAHRLEELLRRTAPGVGKEHRRRLVSTARGIQRLRGEMRGTAASRRW